MPSVITREMLSEALREHLGAGAKHDTAGTGAPPTTGYLHGPGGLLSWPGVDQAVFHTIVGTRPGLANALPAVPSVSDSPTYEILTGIRADTAGQAEPATVCDNAPIGGVLKGGIVTAAFGRYMRATRRIDVGRLGRVNDRADPMDLQLVGNVNGTNFMGQNEVLPRDILVNEFTNVMHERAVSIFRLLNRQFWTGNPANNNAGDGYREMTGLNLLVNTGWKDALTGVALPSLYPDIKAFGYRRVDSNGTMIVNALAYMTHYVTDLAERTGVMPVRWAFVMRPALFYELTKVWPCAYYTTLCSTGVTGIVQNIDMGDQLAMRNEMRSGQFLEIDGVRWPVILDDSMPEFNNTTNGNVTAGCLSSDIYLLPFSVLGGRSTLYMEYFPFNNRQATEALAQPGVLMRTLENGIWLETVRQTNYCLEFQVRIEPRIVLRTPWLAGRLTNVQYCPLQVPRQPYPDDPYYVNGGASTRPAPSYFKPWS